MHSFWLCLQQRIWSSIHFVCVYNKGSIQISILFYVSLYRQAFFSFCLQQKLHTDKHSFLCAYNKGSIQACILFNVLTKRLYTDNHSFYVLIAMSLYRQAFFFVYLQQRIWLGIFFVRTTKDLVRHYTFFSCVYSKYSACVLFPWCAYSKGYGQGYFFLQTAKTEIRHKFLCLDSHTFLLCANSKGSYQAYIILCANYKGSGQAYIIFMCLQQGL